jgi:hypothetical protein
MRMSISMQPTKTVLPRWMSPKVSNLPALQPAEQAARRLPVAVVEHAAVEGLPEEPPRRM